MSRVSAIAAIGATTRALGKDNDLLFKIPADLKRFRALTEGHPVVMGRKTWESLPAKARPMPGRTNVVVTRNALYDAPGATVCTSLDEALEKAQQAPGAEEIFVIGGGELYAEALPKTDRLYLTLVYDNAPGDVSFPPYPEFTRELEREAHTHNDTRFEYVTLERGTGAAV